jgi:hypothetical protein
MNSVPSENILKLRELTDKLCSMNGSYDSKEVLFKLKYIMSENKKQIDTIKTEKTKLKCYENLYDTMFKILNETKTF